MFIILQPKNQASFHRIPLYAYVDPLFIKKDMKLLLQEQKMIIMHHNRGQSGR